MQLNYSVLKRTQKIFIAYKYDSKEEKRIQTLVEVSVSLFFTLKHHVYKLDSAMPDI